MIFPVHGVTLHFPTSFNHSSLKLLLLRAEISFGPYCFCVCQAEAADLCVWYSDHTAKAFFWCQEIKRKVVVGDGMLQLKRGQGRGVLFQSTCRVIAQMLLPKPRLTSCALWCGYKAPSPGSPCERTSVPVKCRCCLSLTFFAARPIVQFVV